MHHDASRDLATVVRFLPDLVPRSPVLVRVASYSAGPSAAAFDGRPDRIDAGTGFSRAVRAWAHLRDLVRAAAAEDVAILWTAHAALDARVDDHGAVEAGPARRARQAEAVALGAAPAHLRRVWRLAATERRHVSAYVAEQEVVVAWGRVATGTSPATETRTRAVTHRHLEQSGADGPSVEAQAVQWGTEHLALVWSPAPVPPALARALALGFAPPTERAAWEASRSKALREASARAWGESRLSAAERRWAGP